MIREIIKKRIGDGGYTDYWFPKKGETDPKPKRSYSKLSEKYDVIVGTGNYIDDIDAPITDERIRLEKGFVRDMLFLIILTGSVLSLIIVARVITGRKIAGPVRIITNEMNIMAKYDFTESDRIGDLVKYRDEIGRMAESVTKMKQQIKKRSYNNTGRGERSFEFFRRDVIIHSCVLA